MVNDDPATQRGCLLLMLGVAGCTESVSTRPTQTPPVAIPTVTRIAPPVGSSCAKPDECELDRSTGGTGALDSGFPSGRWVLGRLVGYTGGAASGTLTVTVPSAPGQYESRYLFNGFEDLARSHPTTVTPP